MQNLSKTFKYVNANGNSIILNYDNGFLINKPTGIDTITIELTQAQGISQVGSTVQSANIQSRPVSINGVLVGDFQNENKDKLLSVILPNLRGRLYADDYYLDVMPTATPTIEPRPIFARFQFSLLAPYPYWLHDSAESTVLSGLRYLFKLPCNFSREYQFAETLETQFINVPNRGQIPSPFRATFFARNTVVNPSLTNAATNQFMLLNKTMVEGERVVVDITHDKTYVTSSVDGDIRGALSLSSNLFRLAVGDNVLKPGATSGVSDLEVTIEFSTEKVGIVL